MDDHAFQPIVLEAHRLGNMRLPSPLAVLGPVLGQVQPPVHQGGTVGRDVGQEDADLAVVDLAQAAAPLPAYAAGGGALLGKAAAVHDQHGLGVAQFGSDVPAQVVPAPAAQSFCPFNATP